MRPTDESRREIGPFLSRAVRFVLVGLGLYALLYVASEALLRGYAERNRFYAVHSADTSHYDFVILGASHAAVFDYRDLNLELEALTGARIINLATLGGGLTVNRLLLDYFLEEHDVDVVVYVLDSFAFYSSAWNEERIRDAELFLRAPWDPSLAALLLRHPAGRAVALDYMTGFSKINNADRFQPDSFPAEGSAFERSYRPVPQIDRQRIDFLYPSEVDPTGSTAVRYFGELEALVERTRSEGARFVVVRPPVPERMRAMIPQERGFDVVLAAVLRSLDVPHFDFSNAIPDDDLYYDSDHLNREGALTFIYEYFGPLLSALGP